MSAIWTTCFVLATCPRGALGWGLNGSRLRARLAVGRRRVVRGNHAEGVRFAEIQRAELGVTGAHGIFQHGLEHRLQLARRARNDAQHFRGSGLLFQRLAKIGGALVQLVEQAGVLYRDNGLSGEVLDQLDLLVGEWADLLAIDDNAANQLILLEHWHLNERARPGELDQRRTCVWLFHRAVGNLDDLPCLDDTAHKGRNLWVPPSQFFELTRSAMHGNRSEFIPLE